MKITGLDHISIFVNDIQKSLEFYTNILGFTDFSSKEISETKKGLIFGNMKINLTALQNNDKLIKPKSPTPGSTIICFMTKTPLKDIIHFLREKEIEILSGPERHMGATNLLISVQINDPDGNVIEIANSVT